MVAMLLWIVGRGGRSQILAADGGSVWRAEEVEIVVSCVSGSRSGDVSVGLLNLHSNRLSGS